MALGEATFAVEWEVGRTLSRDEAVALALKEPTADGRLQTAEFQPSAAFGGRQSAISPLAVLSPREREVALLLGRGLSNERIAAELSVVVKTVERHVTSILSKLGFRSRAEVAAWAVGLGLVAPPEDLEAQIRRSTTDR